MAHVKYYFERDKNKYEKIWDKNEKVTKWISFITNWFWITDITEISSNKRECPVGINGYFLLISIFYVLGFVLQHFNVFDISSYWYTIIDVILVGLMLVIPCLKLMFKFSFYGVTMVWLFFNLLAEDFNWFVYAALVFIVINLLGVLLNKFYFDRIKLLQANGFELIKVEVNKYSCYYLYNTIFKKDIVKLEKALKDEIK